MNVDEIVDDPRLERHERVISAEPRVVDDHGQRWIAGDPLLDVGEVTSIGKVGDHHLGGHTGRVAQALGQLFEPLAAARNQNEIVAVACKPLRECRANPGRCTGHQRPRARA